MSNGWTKEDSAAMDKAALEAEADLKANPPKSVEQFAAWWFKWYMTAGHKRLGRLMVRIAKAKKEGGQ